MSFESATMDKVLSFFEDGIFTIADAADRVRGYVNHAHITSDRLPFVQAHTPVSSSAEGDFGQREGTLTFDLELFDVKGNDDTIRTALESVQAAFRRDPTLGGTVRSVVVDTRGVDERTEYENARVGATVTVTTHDNDIDDGIDLLDFDGNASKMVAPVSGDAVRDSTVIPGGIEYSHGSGLVLGGVNMNNSPGGFTEFPLDLSSVPRLRFLTYLKSPSVASLNYMVFRLTDSSAGWSQYWGIGEEYPLGLSAGSTDPGGPAGWHEFVFDLDTRQQGTGADFSDIVDVTPYIYHLAPYVTTYDYVVQRLFYYPRDRGTNGNSRGF